MHENEGLETYQVKKNLIKLKKCLRKRFKGEKRVFGRWIAMDRSREIEEMKFESHLNLYIEPQ